MAIKVILESENGSASILGFDEKGVELSIHGKSTLSGPKLYVSYYGTQQSAHNIYGSIKIVDERGNTLLWRSKEELDKETPK